MDIETLNAMDSIAAFEAFQKCCGSTNWALQMAAALPFVDEDNLMTTADSIWQYCGKNDFLEAFSHHPKIGDVKSLEKKFAGTADWAKGEQASVASASRNTIEALAQGNQQYEEKFGYIFIVCATGKSAEEMLSLLQTRLPNDPQKELLIAAGEQHKITHIRLKKLLS